MKAAEENSTEPSLIKHKKKDIMKSIRYLAYFTINSNLSFENYPQLLATVNSCDVPIGNINHSRHYITKHLTLVDNILIEDTKGWLNEQKDQSVSVTLDIGTCCGITLVAVLYICGSDVRLANVLTTDFKKEDKLAEMCFEALTIDNKVT